MYPSERIVLLRRLILVIGSCGWLLPLWGAYQSYLTFIRNEVVSPLFNNPHPSAVNFGDISSVLASTAAVWLAVVIAHWAWVASRTGRASTPAS